MLSAIFAKLLNRSLQPDGMTIDIDAFTFSRAYRKDEATIVPVGTVYGCAAGKQVEKELWLQSDGGDRRVVDGSLYDAMFG